MRNIRLIIEYDGGRYHGWQSAKKEESSTISGKISEVLRRMTNEEIRLYCGEKTEAGVHAYGQTANFKTACEMPAGEIRQYLNRYLPLDIRICHVEEAKERFHAELNPHCVVYRYRIMTGVCVDVFRRKYVDFRKKEPDIRAMEEAAGKLCGCRDFRAFSFGRTKKSTVRELKEIEIRTGDETEIFLKADGFLKKMPHRLVGTLLEVGYGERSAECIDRIFSGEENAGECVSHALFLERIEYRAE